MSQENKNTPAAQVDETTQAQLGVLEEQVTKLNADIAERDEVIEELKAKVDSLSIGPSKGAAKKVTTKVGNKTYTARFTKFRDGNGKVIDLTKYPAKALKELVEKFPSVWV